MSSEVLESRKKRKKKKHAALEHALTDIEGKEQAQSIVSVVDRGVSDALK